MKRRMISILMVVVLMATLAAGCGSKVKEPEKPQEQGTVANSGEDRQETPEVTEEAASSVLKDGNMVELLVLLPGPTSHPADQEAVEDAMNEIIAKTIDAKIKFQVVEWGSWVDQVNLMMAGGEKLDLLVYADPTLIGNMARRGQLKSMSELAPVYAKEALASAGKYVGACYVGDDYYGLPTFRDVATSGGITCRKDWLDETGMKAEDIKTWDDIEVLFDKVQENHPGVYMVAGNLHSALLNYAGLYFDGPVAGAGCRMDDNDGHVDILNTYATEEYMEMAKRAYKWNQKGYFIPEPTTQNTLYEDWIRADQCFATIGGVHPGSAPDVGRSVGKEMVGIRIEPRKLVTNSVAWFQWIIPAQCEAPEKACAVMNLLYSDPDMVNLFQFGVEGKDWVFKDEAKGIITYPEGVDGTNVGWSYGMALVGDGSIGYLMDAWPEGIYEAYKEYNDTAPVSPLYGFIYDNSNVKNEITAIGNVLAKYEAVIGCGLAEPEETVAKLLKELEAAGIQNVIDDVQRQVDAWESTK